MNLAVTQPMLWRSTAWLVSAILLMSSCAGDPGNNADDSAGSVPTTSGAPATTLPEQTGTTTSTAPPTTTTTSTAPPTTTTTTSTAPPTTTTTSTAPPTTTEPERHEEAPLLFDLLVADDEWYTGVDGDPLRATVRSGPGTFYDQTTMIEVPRLVIEGTGAVRSDDQGVAWRELKLGHERTGWVEADRLEINSAAQTSYFDDPCATEGAAQGPVPISGATRSVSTGATEGHVAQMWHLLGPGCDRLHIAFGEGWAYRGGSLAAAVPQGVSVEAFGTWARITVPGLGSARFDADAEQGWNLTSIVARAADGTVVIDVYAPQPSQFAAHVLPNPARVLLDVIPGGSDNGDSPPHAGLQLHANLGNLAAVAWPGPPDAENPLAVALPLTVRGYARCFESVCNIRIERADGSPATATVSGPQVFRPGRGSNWAVTATDWSGVWGTFEFVLDNVEPGEYRLNVGEQVDPEFAGVSFRGVTIPFLVLGS